MEGPVLVAVPVLLALGTEDFEQLAVAFLLVLGFDEVALLGEGEAALLASRRLTKGAVGLLGQFCRDRVRHVSPSLRSSEVVGPWGSRDLMQAMRRSR